MNGKSFGIGVGLGMAACAAITAAVWPKKKKPVKKAARILGDVLNNLSDMIG